MYNLEYFRSNIQFLKQQVHDQIRLFLETHKIKLPIAIKDLSRSGDIVYVNIHNHIVSFHTAYGNKPIQDFLSLEQMIQIFEDILYFQNDQFHTTKKMYAKIIQTNHDFWYKSMQGKIFEVREFIGRGIMQDMKGVGHLEPDQCVAVFENEEWNDCIIVKDHCNIYETSIPREKWGAHSNHCCPHFGCKYGDEDCPVTIGVIEAYNVCQDCSSTPECRLHNPKG